MAEQSMSGHLGDVKDTRALIANEQEPHEQAPPYTPYAPQPATQRQQPMWYNDYAEQYNSNVPPPPYPGTWQGGVSPQQVALQGYPAAPYSLPTPSQPNVVMVQGPPGVVDCRAQENYRTTRGCIIAMAEQSMSGHLGDVKDTRGLIANEQEPHEQAPPYTPYAPQPATQRQQPTWYNDYAEQYNSSVPPPPYPGTWQGGVSPQQVAPQGYPAAPYSVPTPSQPNVVMVQGPPGVVDCRAQENYRTTRGCIIAVIIIVKIVVIVVVLAVVLSLT